MTTNLGLMLVTDHDRPDRCKIWPHRPAAIRKEAGKPLLHIVERSYRVATTYSIAIQSKRNLDLRVHDDRDRAKLTTALLDLNHSGVEIPEVTPQLIDDALAAPTLSIPERADRLLVFIGRQCDTIDEVFSLGPEEHRYGALAWTESVTDSELIYIWNYIRDEMKWIKLPEVGPNRQHVDPLKDCIITPAGHARIAELSNRTDSAQAFVAMWFDCTMDEVYDCAIKPAIQDAGYDAVRIDRENFTGHIAVEIEKQIRQSRFIVADVTHGKDGARVNVYLEVGRTLGLDIPVIFTAEDGTVLPFDTSNYQHMFWTRDRLNDFRSALTDRILKLPGLGPGPRLT